MQKKDSLATLTEEVEKFCSERDWDQFHDLKELAIGLITESAELLELFRFQSKEASEAMLRDPSSREKVLDELADALFFVLRIAGKYRLDLGEALDHKLAKNRLKYPVEKSRGSNKKYDQL